MIGDNMMVTADNRSLWLVIGLITLAVMVFAGGHFYRSAWKSLLNGAATMDTLVALGTGVAWLYSMSVNLWPQWFPMEARHLYYEASAMIIGLINLGHMLEARARQRSSKALEKLLDLTRRRRAWLLTKVKKRAAGGSSARHATAPDDGRPRASRWRDYPGRSMAG